MGEILGEGGFGKVYKGVHKETGEEVAVKYMDITEMLQHADQIEEIYREAEALQKLNHKGIIHLHKAFVQKKTVIMVLEYCGGGELYERMQEVRTMNELETREIFLQIVSAMSYCHNRGLIHRDLKLENVMFKRAGGFDFTVKVVDFGIAGSCRPSFEDQTNAGSLAYMPPETLGDEPVAADSSMDVWAIGCMVFAMLIGHLPFYGNTQEEFEEAILTTTPSFTERYSTGGESVTPPVISKQAQDLILRMLDKDPKKRITLFEVQEHEWSIMDDDELEAKIEEAKKCAEQEQKDLEEAKAEEEEKQAIARREKREKNEGTKKKKYNPSLDIKLSKKKGKRTVKKIKSKKDN